VVANHFPLSTFLAENVRRADGDLLDLALDVDILAALVIARSLLVSHPKHRLGQPATEGLVVLELFEELRVVFEHRRDHPLQRLVVLDPGRARRVLHRSLFGSVSLLSDRCAVIIGKRLLNRLGVVLEIEHEDIALFWVCPVQARQRLHGLDAAEHPVHIHRVQERFIVAGLEFVGADQKAIRVFLHPVGNIVARKAVELRPADFLAVVFRLAGERMKRSRGCIRSFLYTST